MRPSSKENGSEKAINVEVLDTRTRNASNVERMAIGRSNVHRKRHYAIIASSPAIRLSNVRKNDMHTSLTKKKMNIHSFLTSPTSYH